MRAIEGSMGALEQQYIALSRSINADSAGTIGLAPVAATSYVYRQTDAAMADARRNQI